MVTPAKSQTDQNAEVKAVAPEVQVKMHNDTDEIQEKLHKAADKVQEKMHKSFQNVSTAILTIATFAAGVTFNILLKPADAGGPPPAVIYLSYANSLFCAAIMGCTLIMLSIELVGHSVSETVRRRINFEVEAVRQRINKKLKMGLAEHSVKLDEQSVDTVRSRRPASFLVRYD
jgi:hypothetical protein